MTRWLIRGIATLVLLVTAAILAVAGTVFPFGAAANNGFGSGQLSPGFVAIGVALVAVAVALVWLAWRLRPRRAAQIGGVDRIGRRE